MRNTLSEGQPDPHRTSYAAGGQGDSDRGRSGDTPGHREYVLRFRQTFSSVDQSGQ